MGNLLNLNGHRLETRQVFDPTRFEQPHLRIEPSPTFAMTRADPVFVMGSCFAQVIRRALATRGFDVTDAGLGNQYNPLSMTQQVRWALRGGFDANLLVAALANAERPLCDLVQSMINLLEQRGFPLT